MKTQHEEVDRIEKIFQKALELFVERGYDNTPLSLVAKETGLSKAGVYHYFDSKEHLLFLLHKSRIEKSLLPLLEKARLESDPERRLTTFLKDYIHMLILEPTTQMLVHESKRLLPEHRQKILAYWRKVVSLLTGTIEELKNQGKVPQGLNATFAAFAAIGMCVWTPHWFDKSRTESLGELTDTLTNIFMAGIHADSSASSEDKLSISAER